MVGLAAGEKAKGLIVTGRANTSVNTTGSVNVDSNGKITATGSASIGVVNVTADVSLKLSKKIEFALYHGNLKVFDGATASFEPITLYEPPAA